MPTHFTGNGAGSTTGPERALVIGITGQDGSYLAELLLDKDYEVHGTIRRSSVGNIQRIAHIVDRLHLHFADLADGVSIMQAVAESRPAEIYALGALSHVGMSFDVPEYAADVTGVGCLRLLEAARQFAPEARIYQAGSSEMFGMNPEIPTNETSGFRPASPYAVAKCFAFHTAVNYRDAYDLHVSNGILFNHESPRRGTDFVTRKITRGIAAIIDGRSDELVLGNLDAKRDWGHARDFVEAMWLMVQAPRPSDYVVATGETHSVREFLDLAFDELNMNWHEFVRTDPRFYRPVDPPVLQGDATKARETLGWVPRVTFPELVREMVWADVSAPELRRTISSG